MEKGIQVEGLTKRFGNQRALRGVDFEVREGESVVLFGPNGAGKTTLIKILATIINPTSGEVHVDGLDLKKESEEIRRKLGVVTHQPFLYGNLTGYENLLFYCRMYDVPRSKERVEELAAVVGMTGRLHDRVNTLSHGMKQRLSIARALLHRPSIMLLDEPETGLDQQASSLWQALRCEGALKRTIIATTHNLDRGLEMGERMVILSKGKIVYQELAQALTSVSLKEAYQECTGVRL